MRALRSIFEKLKHSSFLEVSITAEGIASPFQTHIVDSSQLRHVQPEVKTGEEKLTPPWQLGESVILKGSGELRQK